MPVEAKASSRRGALRQDRGRPYHDNAQIQRHLRDIAFRSRLWCRLGHRLDWLLKLFDLLPVDNEGDAPERIWRGAVITRAGRLLNARTGRIESRHRLEYATGKGRTLVRIDGESIIPFAAARERYCFPLHEYDKAPMEALLGSHGLEWSSVTQSAQRSPDRVGRSGSKHVECRPAPAV